MTLSLYPKLTEIKAEIEDNGGGTVNSLQDAFDESVSGGFDPTYNKVGVDTQYEFKNYEHGSPAFFDITSVTVSPKAPSDTSPGNTFTATINITNTGGDIGTTQSIYARWYDPSNNLLETDVTSKTIASSASTQFTQSWQSVEGIHGDGIYKVIVSTNDDSYERSFLLYTS